MFKDYSDDLLKIKELLFDILKRIDVLEKDINGVSDEVNTIRTHLGLDRRTRIGKRHRVDILQLIDDILLQFSDAKDKEIFYTIESLLMENDGIESAYTSHYGYGIMKNDEKEKIYKEWEKKIEPQWLEIIQTERRMLKDEIKDKLKIKQKTNE